tara:strand:- start:1222 stop:1356 length:135 start_codon:yes stop_codon:yes gene_type:complete
MALKKHIVLYTIEKTSGLGFVFLRITTMGTSEIEKVITFLLKQI